MVIWQNNDTISHTIMTTWDQSIYLNRQAFSLRAAAGQKVSFTFTKPAAIRNLADYETSEALAEVRHRFAGKSNSHLLDRKFIDSLTVRRSTDAHLPYRDSVAHALLERGIGCRMGCVADFLIPHK